MRRARSVAGSDRDELDLDLARRIPVENSDRCAADERRAIGRGAHRVLAPFKRAHTANAMTITFERASKPVQLAVEITP